MSEEKPTFKVTDRRLFNPDGTPREGVEREEPTPAPQPAPAAQTQAPAREEAREASPQASGGARAAAAQEPAAPPRAESGAAAGAGREEEGEQEFLMAVEFIASFAAEALGMSAHPGEVGAATQVNLPLARQCIDMLGALQRKTSGNLNEEEQHFLELILSQLRMQYVSLTTAPRPPKSGRGFTGGDITGGR